MKQRIKRKTFYYYYYYYNLRKKSAVEAELQKMTEERSKDIGAKNHRQFVKTGSMNWKLIICAV